MKITIDDIPPSLNSIIFMAKKHWGAYYGYKKKWKDKVHACISDDSVLFKEPVIITITYFFGNKHKHDFDNYSGKFILDGLSGKVIEDDSSKQITELRIRFNYDKDNPRTEVDIKKG